MAEICMNCEYNDKGCLMKGALITMLYLETGRADELPETTKEANLRMFCNMRKEKSNETTR